MKPSRRSFLLQILSLTGGASVCGGCGTLLHQERIHEPHSRDIDWKVAALDGLGLALFFVPGVVAFVVDFYTGAIYLPPRGTPGYPVAIDATLDEGEVTLKTPNLQDWQHHAIPVDEIKTARLEQVVGKHVGSPVSLHASSTRVSVLSGWSRFCDQLRAHENDALFGASVSGFFRKLGHC